MHSRELEFIALICEERREVPPGAGDTVEAIAVATGLLAFAEGDHLSIEERLVKAGAALMLAFERITPEEEEGIQCQIERCSNGSSPPPAKGRG